MRDDDNDEDRSWLARNWVGGTALTAGLGIAAALVSFIVTQQDAKPVMRAVQQVTLITPPPPKVEPPKPPEPEPIKQPEFQDQKPFEELKDLPPLPDVPPAPALGVDAVGQGAGDAFGLVGRPGGRGLLEGSGGGGGGGDRIVALYGRSVESALRAALAQHDTIRYAAFRSITAQIWLGPDGRIWKGRLRTSTGDSNLDRDLVREFLVGFRMKEPPPPDMAMPIVIKLEGRSSRPS